MNYQIEKFETFVTLLEKHSPNEGLNLTSIKNLATFKVSKPQARQQIIEVPGIVIVGQGKKECYIGNLTDTSKPGHVSVGFYPIPLEVEIVEASQETPYLWAGLQMDMGRMAEVLLRLDKVDKTAPNIKSPERRSKYSFPLNNRLLDPFIRLLE
ncbi:MAG: AraC family transcriptional regulator [Chloroflexota bacterium]